MIHIDPKQWPHEAAPAALGARSIGSILGDLPLIAGLRDVTRVHRHHPQSSGALRLQSPTG